jgi:hypothetical protein
MRDAYDFICTMGHVSLCLMSVHHMGKCVTSWAVGARQVETAMSVMEARHTVRSGRQCTALMGLSRLGFFQLELVSASSSSFYDHCRRLHLLLSRLQCFAITPRACTVCWRRRQDRQIRRSEWNMLNYLFL